MPTVTLLPHNLILRAESGINLHRLLAREGLIDAPCGGNGKCGKCRVIADGREVLACQTEIHGDMTVRLPQRAANTAAAKAGKRAAFDIGTTTLVCCLLDEDGNVVASASARNPQTAYGADVVSRIRAAQAGEAEALTVLVRRAMTELLCSICRSPEEIEAISVVGNPTMQQLFLGIPVENLARIPYTRVLCKPVVSDAAEIFPICPRAKLLTVPDISGFVGADTVAAILSCGLQDKDELTLLVDIGTNSEMVLGNKGRMIACAAAAGPALEGANIQFGMRAEPGAIDRVWLEQSRLQCSTVGGIEATGICGTGLVDAVAAAMDMGLVNHRGKIAGDDKIMLTDRVYLTQEDIRQVMLAKGAIRAGIERMAAHLGAAVADIQHVVLAGAFGSFLNPENACRIGLLPEELLPKITAAGNAAGKGAVLLAADPEKLGLTAQIAEKVEYLDLSVLPAFPKAFAKAMELPQNWCHSARKLGFTHAYPLDPAALQPREDVRAMCAADRCRAYGKNWTCPPHCGTVSQCEAQMRRYRRGILLQTVGQLTKDIDTKGYRAAEQRHLISFSAFCAAIRRQHPDALCLGTGGCRICGECAWPEGCRFPELATSSMEGYGLFVTRVCRDCGAEYYHGEKTVTYTACVLY